MKDITGRKFGLLTAIGLHPTERYRKERKWIFHCDCGKEIVLRKCQVISGNTRSCGCMTNYWKSEHKKLHGLGHTGLARTLSHMKWRCDNPNCPQYKNYGARGITICDEWRNDIRAFIRWAYVSGYKPGLTIERIDVNGNYCPENCTWISNEDQWKNRREKCNKHFGGARISLKAVCKERGLDYSVIKERLTLGWELSKALSTPIEKKKLFYDEQGQRVIVAQIARENAVSVTRLRTLLQSGLSLAVSLEKLRHGNFPRSK